MSRARSGSATQHLELAQANLATYQVLAVPPRWRLVVLFYSALHQVAAVAAARSITHSGHDHRAHWLSSESRKVGARYADLRAASETARYQPGRLPYNDGQISTDGHFYRRDYLPVTHWAAEQLDTEPILATEVPVT